MLNKSWKFTIIFGAWIIVSLLTLTFFHSLDIEHIFICCLIGFIIIEEMLSPIFEEKKYNTIVNVIIIVGSLIFFLMLANQALYTLSP